MNQKKLKSAIAKMVKSVIGIRKVEPGLFHTTGQEPELKSFNLDLLGDPHRNDLWSQMPLWERTTVLPENGLVDLYLYTLGFHGELDINLLVRIVGAKVVQIFENSEDPQNEIPLVAKDPKTLVPFTVREARQFLGISEEDVPQVSRFLAMTEQSDCQPVELLGHIYHYVNQAHKDGWIRMQGSEVKDGDSVLIHGVGQCVLIGEVS